LHSAKSFMAAALALVPFTNSDTVVPEREMQHARQLLASYHAAADDQGAPTALLSSMSAGTPEAAGAAAGSGGRASGGRGSKGGVGGEDDGGAESWAGEGYEPTQLRGVVRSYVKFSKRVERQPLQCVRCGHGHPRVALCKAVAVVPAALSITV
jgi:hypothetical protein